MDLINLQNINVSYDKKNNIFKRENRAVIDFGLDFYAPQTFEDTDGRRIMIAWMHSWENRVVPNDFKWCGMMTIPRELNIKDGRLFLLFAYLLICLKTLHDIQYLKLSIKQLL